eukprot:4589995-Amphidinium_carterae.1
MEPSGQQEASLAAATTLMVFSLTSAYYHLSMIPGYGEHQPTSDAATTGQPAPTDTTAGQQPTAS